MFLVQYHIISTVQYSTVQYNTEYRLCVQSTGYVHYQLVVLYTAIFMSVHCSVGGIWTVG